MTIPMLLFAGLAGAFITLGIWRRHWLLAAWLVSLLLLPTAQGRVSGAPFYLYDLAAVILIASLAASGELTRWPRGVPCWHWRFIGAALLLSVGFGFVRFGLLPDIVWIWGHASLAWMAFAFGTVVMVSQASPLYRNTLTWTVLLISLAFCVMALVQFVDLPGSEQISAWYYGDLGSEKSVEILRLGKQSNRATGPHFAPTSFGGIALLLGVVCWLLTEGRHRWTRLLVSTTAITTVLCTVSRHVMLALLAGLAVFVLTSDLRRKAKLVIGLLGFTALISTSAIGFLAREGWSTRLDRWDQGILSDENIAARLFYGPTRLFHAIQTDPSILLTGAGLDPEKLIARNNNADQKESGFVSNGFLLSLYYLGIGGLALYVAFWWWSWRLVSLFPRPLRPVLSSLVVMSILIVAADNYSFMYEPAVALLFLIPSLISGRRHQMWTEETTVLAQQPDSTEPRPIEGGAYAA